jgi:hypothetical protein
MTVALGWKPQDIQVILSAGQDFILEIVPDDPTAIPDGTLVKIDLYSPGTQKMSVDSWPDPLDSWDGTVSGGIVRWNVPSDKPDLIPQKAWARLIITYEGGADYVWAHGYVVRDD